MQDYADVTLDGSSTRVECLNFKGNILRFYAYGVCVLVVDADKLVNALAEDGLVGRKVDHYVVKKHGLFLFSSVSKDIFCEKVEDADELPLDEAKAIASEIGGEVVPVYEGE